MNQLAPCLSLAIALSSSAAHAGTVGKIVLLEGSAWRIAAGGAMQSLKIGASVDAGERLGTNANSQMIIKLDDDGSAILLKARSEATVAPAKAAGPRDWIVSLKQGGALFNVKNPLKRPEHFQVRSRSVVMGVRGTTFFVRDEPGKPVFFCDCKGKVEVTNSDGKGSQVFVSKHHDAPTFIADGGAKTRSLAARLSSAAGTDFGHSDADLALIETSTR